MNIGERLRSLRMAKGYSQGDIEHKTGLLRCYVSRVENGHTEPSVSTIEKWAGALEVQLYQIFYAGKPEALKLKPVKKRGSAEVLDGLSPVDKQMVIRLVNRLKKKGS